MHEKATRRSCPQPVTVETKEAVRQYAALWLVAFVVGHAGPFGDRRGEAPLRTLGVHRRWSKFSVTMDDRSHAHYR